MFRYSYLVYIQIDVLFDWKQTNNIEVYIAGWVCLYPSTEHEE